MVMRLYVYKNYFPAMNGDMTHLFTEGQTSLINIKFDDVLMLS